MIKNKSPNFKADMVQICSIASSATARLGRKITNEDVYKICKHLGIEPVSIPEDVKHYYVPKLQAYGVWDALMNYQHQQDATLAELREAKPVTPPPCDLKDYEDKALLDELRRRGFRGTLTRMNPQNYAV